MVESLRGKTGLVLAGAVAHGAFEAGAIAALAENHHGLRVVRIAGTSSGALNAAVIAVGVATGRLAKAAKVLEDLWLGEGSLWSIARLPVRDWPKVWIDRAHLRGVLETARLQALVKKAMGEVMAGWAREEPEPVTLTLVTTNLNGLGEHRGAVPLPVYEQPLRFDASQLVDENTQQTIAHAAAASATFPVLFVPTAVEGSPCIDGGAVNNAPISYVLREPNARRVGRTKPDVDSVVVVTTESSQVAKVAELGATKLAARVASALIDERIAYDLAQALETNARYAALEKTLEGLKTPPTPEERERVFGAAGCWPVNLYLIQPEPPLEGDAFSGFFDGDLRRKYVEAGKSAGPRLLGPAPMLSKPVIAAE